MENDTVPATQFINVQVIATPEIDHQTGKTKYTTTFTPETITVTSYDTVLNYQLIAPTPPGVRITKISVAPKHSEQLSPATIGRSGKIATFSDANTIKEAINVTLHFVDADTVEFAVDPIIENEPPTPPM